MRLHVRKLLKIKLMQRKNMIFLHEKFLGIHIALQCPVFTGLLTEVWENTATDNGFGEAA